ncbi:SMI1/KNR4 family protein [Vibrio alfacsensis]|uniref:SMI1/KNR4 family protein n=1 Tax=Vibrio alfacsensis TaxID=1074311 RepID=UPI004067D21F
MTENKIDKAVQMMQRTGEEVLQIGGASEELITQAEKVLGVVFPKDYRYFLKTYGAISFESEEFYGLTKKGLEATSIPCVVFATLSARELGDISTSMVKIKSTGYGPSFSLDVSQKDEAGNCPVIETTLSYKVNSQIKRVANSFSEFFWDEIQNAIDEL